MHDRRINGETYVFGNAGGLYKNAMTWWDHETLSIWSQPIGQAIAGPLKRTALTLLPSRMTTWANWKASHPETLALTTAYEQLGFRHQKFDGDFVIGVVLTGLAKAYPYEAVAAPGVINDTLGEFPILIWARDGDYRTYLRKVDGQRLTFEVIEGKLRDQETSSR